MSVPLTAAAQLERYGDKFSPLANLTGATLTLRLYAPGATGGSLGLYPVDADFTYGPQRTIALSSISAGWTDVDVPIGNLMGAFDPSGIGQITIEVSSGTSTSWTNPTVVYLDSVRSSNVVVNDTFDSSIGNMVSSSVAIVAGSTLGWVASTP